MHGNVWEWVKDCWSRNYYKAPDVGVVLEVGVCKDRILRGGSKSSAKHDLRSARRWFAAGHDRRLNVGFRLVYATK